MFAFKVIFKNVFGLISTRAGRRFLILCIKNGDRKRFFSRNIRLFKYKFCYVDNMSFLWQFHDIFVKEVYRFKAQNKAPLIIDCGSNIGLSIIYFKKHYPESRVIGFEADPDIYNVQQKNIGSLKNVECHNKAVWVNSDGIKLYRNNADGAYVSDKGDVNVKSIRLRDFLKGFKYIDLLKLDIEGAEFQILEDCHDQLSMVDKLFVEMHTFSGQKQNIARLIDIVEKAGFRYFIENANDQKWPLFSEWRTGDTGMDMQLNLYAIRE